MAEFCPIWLKVKIYKGNQKEPYFVSVRTPISFPERKYGE